MVGPYESYHFISNLENKKFWLLIITDVCTRFSKVMLLEKPEADNLCRLLCEEWFNTYGNPTTIISDQGKPYESKQYKSILKERGILPSYISTYNPTANGISERINSTISAVLRICRSKPLDHAIEVINIRLNCSYHRILSSSPFELKNNYSYLDPLKRHVDKIDLAKMRTLKNIKDSEEKRNESRDKKYTYNLHDRVYIQKVLKGKLDDRFEGPFRVIGTMDNRLLLEMNGKREWVNLKRVKPCLSEEGKDVVQRMRAAGRWRHA